MILFDLGVAIGPVLGYYSQLNLIKKEKSVGSFSIDVCAILMISGILRIFFWFTTGYAINLLFQAIFIIIIQVNCSLKQALLLKECIELDPRDRSLPEKFWRWRTFDQYSNYSNNIVKFLLGLTAVVTVTTLLSSLLWIPFYGSFIGFASLSIEATLGMPQLLSNYRTKSVEGLSFFMIFTWFVGDFFKTLYFII